MSYIAELINKECPECQGEKVSKILKSVGVWNQTFEKHFEIFNFFKDKKTHWMGLRKSEYNATVLATRSACEHFTVSRFMLMRIRKRFE